jgi:hypothetical protein
MSGHHSFEELRNRMSPEAQAKSAAESARLRKEIDQAKNSDAAKGRGA